MRISLFVALFIFAFGCTQTEFGGSSARRGSDAKGRDGGPDGGPDGGSDNPFDRDNDLDDGGPDGGGGNDDGGADDDDFDMGRNVEEDDDDNDDPIRIFDDDKNAYFLVKPVEPEQSNHLWIVTTAGNAYYFEIEDDEIKSEKKWTGITGGGGGARTYVTEGGVVIAKTGGHLYWIDPEDTPQGAVPRSQPNYFKLDGVGGDDRVCIVSYRRDKKRYLGMGFGPGKFVEIAMKNTAPFEPDWGDRTGTVDVGTPRWGYSCYIDQDKLIYYGAYHDQPPKAVDLEDLDEVSPTRAPNGNFTSDNLGDETVGPKGVGSYAMSGDRGGNVLNGKGYYTFAYEPVSNTVWGTGRNGGTLSIFPSECFHEEEDCDGFATFNMAQLGIAARPLSAMGNGAMIGVSRESNGSVYLMRLKDPDDLAEGIESTRLTQVDGDPYMYTDFTGATLYLTRTENTFELDEADDFDRGTVNRAIGFTWSAKDQDQKEWEDIKLKIRCYDEGGDPPSYETWDDVNDAGRQTIIKADGCVDRKYDAVDILLTQENDEDTLMNVKRIQVTVYQK